MARSRRTARIDRRGPGEALRNAVAEVENRLLNAAEVATATGSPEVNLASALTDAVIEPGAGPSSPGRSRKRQAPRTGRTTEPSPAGAASKKRRVKRPRRSHSK